MARLFERVGQLDILVNDICPHFLRWLHENQPEVAASWKKLDDTFYSYWGSMPYQMPG